MSLGLRSGWNGDSSGEELRKKCRSPMISPVASLVSEETSHECSVVSQECLVGKRWYSWRSREVSTKSLFQTGQLEGRPEYTDCNCRPQGTDCLPTLPSAHLAFKAAQDSPLGGKTEERERSLEAVLPLGLGSMGSMGSMEIFQVHSWTV